MSPEAITFSNFDVSARMRLRSLRQFSKSPVFQQVLAALAQEIQLVSDTCLNVLDNRTLAHATGSQLDVIGRIVGQGRVIPYYTINEVNWFTPDQVGSDLDTGYMWVTNGVDGNPHTMTDPEYLDMIIAKIYRNTCRTGSSTEIMTYAQLALGIPVSAVSNSNGNIDLIIPPYADEWKVLWAKRFVTDNRGDVIPVMPYPVGMIVENIQYDATTGFAFYLTSTGEYYSSSEALNEMYILVQA